MSTEIETRAKAAQIAISARREFLNNGEDSIDSEIIDTIADLLHLATQNGEDVERIIRCARMHHDAEQEGA